MTRVSPWQWALAYDEIGLYPWPGHKGRDGDKKIPKKAKHLPPDSPRLTVYTTLPHAGAWARGVWDDPGLVGHVPGLARVPLLELDLDTRAAIDAARPFFDASTHPLVRTGRGVRVMARAPDDIASAPLEARPLDWHTRLPGTLLKAEVLCIKWSVLPPSIHPNGRPYEWHGAWADGVTDLDAIPLAPDWMLERISSAARPGSASHRVTTTGEALSAEEMALAMKTLERQGTPNQDVRLTVIRDLKARVATLAVLTKGSRNDALYRIASLCSAYRAHGLLVDVDLSRLLRDIERACTVNGHDTDHAGDRDRILTRFGLTGPASPKETSA